MEKLIDPAIVQIFTEHPLAVIAIILLNILLGGSGGFFGKKLTDKAQDLKIAALMKEIEKLKEDMKEVTAKEQRNAESDENFQSLCSSKFGEISKALGRLEEGQTKMIDHVIDLNKRMPASG
jgi:hypothetical protein